MKTLLKSAALTFVGLISFSFTNLDEQPPKVVIVDIVDNIETTNNQNLTQTFRERIATLNQSEDVKVLEWKEITNGLDDNKKQALLDSINPEVVLTLNFKNAQKGDNAVTAVVSKNNKNFDYSIDTARQLTGALENATIKNEGVFQAESEYVQDNAVPAMFVSIETKNDESSNKAIVETLAEFIKNVDDEKVVETTTDVETSTDNQQIQIKKENQEIKID